MVGARFLLVKRKFFFRRGLREKALTFLLLLNSRFTFIYTSRRDRGGGFAKPRELVVMVFWRYRINDNRGDDYNDSFLAARISSSEVRDLRS